jgi:hypothetical protein
VWGYSTLTSIILAVSLVQSAVEAPTSHDDVAQDTISYRVTQQTINPQGGPGLSGFGELKLQVKAKHGRQLVDMGGGDVAFFDADGDRELTDKDIFSFRRQDLPVDVNLGQGLSSPGHASALTTKLTIAIPGYAQIVCDNLVQRATAEPSLDADSKFSGDVYCETGFQLKLHYEGRIGPGGSVHNVGLKFTRPGYPPMNFSYSNFDTAPNVRIPFPIGLIYSQRLILIALSSQ